MILSFVHIEKSAGTTLNHLLRKNFFLTFIDVRPLSVESNRCFTSDDMRKYLYINPFLKAISGHSIIRPSSLSAAFPEIQYITVLREPVKRYLSQFKYLVYLGRIPDDFEQFLTDDRYFDFQTKKLAGCDDVDVAKKTVDSMLEVGAVEEFDAFLLRLKKALYPIRFNPHYKMQNVTRQSGIKADLLARYGDEILKRNEKDHALYRYVIEELIPQRNALYGPDLDDDLKRFRKENIRVGQSFKTCFDYAVRKLYYERMSGIIRRLNGLPSKGSY